MLFNFEKLIEVCFKLIQYSRILILLFFQERAYFYQFLKVKAKLCSNFIAYNFTIQYFLRKLSLNIVFQFK